VFNYPPKNILFLGVFSPKKTPTRDVLINEWQGIEPYLQPLFVETHQKIMVGLSLLEPRQSGITTNSLTHNERPCSISSTVL